MIIKKLSLGLAIVGMAIIFPTILLQSQEAAEPFSGQEAALGGEVAAEEEASGNVTLDFKDADIKNVLRILSYKGGVNIVAGKGVEGPVTIRLTDVPWDKALEVLLKTYDYGYEKDGNIITVTPLEVLTKKKAAERKLAEVEPLVTEVFTLQYIDASDAKAVIENQLSARGKATVFRKTLQKGWSFGSGGGSSSGSGVGGFGVRERSESDEPRATTIVISDIASYMERIKKIIIEVDTKPKQVLIEARIVEVNRDRLKDFGFDWGTGSGITGDDAVDGIGARSGTKGEQISLGSESITSKVTPSIFDPKASGITGVYPFDSGLSFVFRKLTGAQFEVILHALQEDVESNTLSAPRIMTLDNQEAKILIGDSRPILKSEISSGESGSASITQSLDYYQNLGIVLNVIPQVSGEDFINLVVHPAVYSTTDSVSAISQITGGDAATSSYPIILMREADTQILVKSGETVVIGGLLKDVKKEGEFSVPILGDLPIIGMFFKRQTTDLEKIDLLIFLTARIVDENQTSFTDYGVSMMLDEGAGMPEEAQIEDLEKPEEAGIIEAPKEETIGIAEEE